MHPDRDPLKLKCRNGTERTLAVTPSVRLAAALPVGKLHPNCSSAEGGETMPSSTDGDGAEDSGAEEGRGPVQRKKISIRPIPEARKRQVTFMKRKKGLLKKAKELSILCNCEMAVLIFDKHKQCFQFASGDIEETLARFEEAVEDPSMQREHKTNADVRHASLPPTIATALLCGQPARLMVPYVVPNDREAR